MIKPYELMTEQGAEEMSASTAAPAACTWEVEFSEINPSSETQTLYTSLYSGWA